MTERISRSPKVDNSSVGKTSPKVVKANGYNLPKVGKGVVVGPAYSFLFEGENKDYDEQYKDYI